MRQPVHHCYEFGPFRLDLNERELRREGVTVALTPKVFDTLLVLVENAGHIVDKDELMRAVWPDSFVDEGTLTRNISRLRSVLEETAEQPYIETVPRRDYRFVAEVREGWEENTDPILRQPRSVVLSETAVALEIESRRAEHLPAPIVTTPVAHRWPFRRVVWTGTLALVAVVLVLAYFLTPRSSSNPAAVKSLAVLPFKPLHPDSGDEYLGVGIADTLITKLGGLRQLIVRPTSAVLKYHDLQQDALAAGREQRVDAVLDASLQRWGDKVRVTVRLLSVADEATLWTYQCDEQYCADLFVMQDMISEKIALALTAQLSGDERLRLRKHYTENRAAYELYLKGRYFINQGRITQVRRGIESFQQAIATDPNYALAHAGLADAYFRLVRSGAVSPLEAMPKAKAAVQKALELDASLAEAHIALALIKTTYDWDWQGSETEYRRALELNPTEAEAHQWYGHHLVARGRFAEAQRELQRARQLNPLSPSISENIGEAFYYARQYDAALKQCQQTLELEPNYPYTHYMMAKAYSRKGMYQEALTALLPEVSKGRNPAVLAELAAIYVAAGQRDEALKLLAELQQRAQQSYVGRLNFATLYLGLGEREQAWEWLEKAYAERHPRMMFLPVEPAYDPLRADPRFAELLQRIHPTP